MLNFIGRSDGIGNRLEQIIKLEIFCSQENTSVNYYWNNKRRKYPILIAAENVNIVSKRISGTIPLQNYSQTEMLSAARLIKPLFDIHFKEKPIGVHIRGTDRIGKDHPHFMLNNSEFSAYLSRTIAAINKIKPKYLFVCADRAKYKRFFIKHLDKSISVVDPICDAPDVYRDFFALTLCESIYMCSKFSSFSIAASLIGNIPIVSYTHNRETENRFKALFQYRSIANFERINYTLSGGWLSKIFKAAIIKLVIALPLLMFSCTSGPYDYVEAGMVEIIEIDSCEYVFIHTPTGSGLAHKGNCKYCAERAKQLKK